MDAQTLAEHVNDVMLARRLLSRVAESARARHEASELDRVQMSELLLVEQVIDDLKDLSDRLSQVRVFELSDASAGALAPILEVVDRIVCEHYGLTEDDLRSPSRRRDIVDARHLAIYLVREADPRTSWRIIARAYNRSDHTASLYAYTAISDRIEVEDGMREMVEALLSQVKDELNPMHVVEVEE